MAFLLFSCEDVIEVDTPSGEPLLIVDALIKIDISSPSQLVSVRVGLTSTYFGEVPVTSLEQVTITNVDMESTFANPNTLILLETQPGIYEAVKDTSFFTSGELVFQLSHNGRQYFARTHYIPTVPIDDIQKGDGSLFGEDDTEVIVRFTDVAEREDFYIFDFDFNEFLVTEDTFYQGQEFEFSYFYDRDLEAGKEATIRIWGADEGFYNYMNKLIQQGGELMGPFATPAATVRGNVFDVTGLDNVDIFDNVDRPEAFALGYFAVVQEYTSQIEF